MKWSGKLSQEPRSLWQRASHTLQDCGRKRLVSVSAPSRAPVPSGPTAPRPAALLHGWFRLVHVSQVEKATTQVHITEICTAVLPLICLGRILTSKHWGLGIYHLIFPATIEGKYFYFQTMDEGTVVFRA